MTALWLAQGRKRACDDDFIEILKASRHAIGSDGFTDRIGQLYQKLLEKKDILEDVSFREEIAPLAAGDIVDAVCNVMGVEEEEVYRRQRNSMGRPATAHMLCKYAGMTQRDVAKVLNLMGGSAVSLQLRKLNERLNRDEKLKRQIDTACSKLEKIGFDDVAGMQVTQAYNDEKDCLFLEGKGDFGHLTPGMFAILLPHGAHMPGIATDAPASVTKVGVKVRCG